MNISSLMKLALFVMQTRGTWFSSETFDPEYGKNSLLTKEADLREFVALTSDPNAANNLVHIRYRLAFIVSNFSKDYNNIDIGSYSPEDNQYVESNKLYFQRFYSFYRDTDSLQTIDEMSRLARVFLDKFIEIEEMKRRQWYFDRDLNKAQMRISGLTVAWRIVEKYHNEVIKSSNSVSDYGPIATEFQRRLERAYNLLSDIESRVSVVLDFFKMESYGCTKTLLLVDKERKYIKAIYDFSKGLNQSWNQKPSYWVAEINRCMAEEHYASHMDYTWNKFKSIILNRVEKLSDVESSYTTSPTATSSNASTPKR